VTLPCHVGPLDCLGLIRLTTGVSGGRTASAARVVTLASTRFRIRHGRKARVRARYTAAGRRLLRGHRRVKARLAITSVAPTGRRVTRTRRVTLRG
jgi:hypothetical protein